MNVFGIEDWWNLIWIVPAVLILLLLAGAYLPDRKGPTGPPYVGFDARLDAYLEETGRDPKTYGREESPSFRVYGERLHGRTFGPNAPVPENLGEGPHPGSQCGPSCWRKPDGHRWGE